jgi:hypothetical protein
VQNSKLTPGNWTILIAGIVMLIASFLPFYTYHGFTWSAWNSDINLLGNATLPALFGLIMALHVAGTSFANVTLPPRVAGFSWNQVHLLLGFQATVMMVCWLARDKGSSFASLGFGIGFVLMLLGAVALLVGAIMRSRETAATI